MGGDLAQPKNKDDFYKFIIENYPDIKFRIWLGANKLKGDWNWVSGDPVPTEMWKDTPWNQPDGDGDCMDLHWNSDLSNHFINDFQCQAKILYAFELGGYFRKYV